MAFAIEEQSPCSTYVDPRYLDLIGAALQLHGFIHQQPRGKEHSRWKDAHGRLIVCYPSGSIVFQGLHIDTSRELLCCLARGEQPRAQYLPPPTPRLEYICEGAFVLTGCGFKEFARKLRYHGCKTTPHPDTGGYCIVHGPGWRLHLQRRATGQEVVVDGSVDQAAADLAGWGVEVFWG
jgi:hypothetical protein